MPVAAAAAKVFLTVQGVGGEQDAAQAQLPDQRLGRRAPAVNTLRALLHALDPAELEAAFRRHAQHLGAAPASPGRRVVALDGKTLRGSFDHLDDRAAAQVLSAFADEAALILAHQEIAEGDEIAAAQALIERLGLSGVLFTADALHCQKN